MLRNKKLLLIVPEYMGYWKDLKIALQNKYDIVFFLDIKKNIPKIKHSLKQVFDIIFIIRGDTLPYIKSELKANKSLKKILYEWDSLNNFNYLPFLDFFTVVKTFDLKDAKDHNLCYLPLFYSKSDLNFERKIDILFIGIWHSDRYMLLEKFNNLLKKNNRKIYFKLYYKWYFYVPFVILRKIRTFKFYTPFLVSKTKLKKLYRSSNVVLDLNHPNQTGYTMRTIESLGNGCKLITSNKNIKSAPFYNENNIFIFDRNKDIQETELIAFLNKPYVFDCEIEKYEINNWIKQVLSC